MIIFFVRSRNGDLTCHFIPSSKDKQQTSAAVILMGVAAGEVARALKEVLEVNDSGRGLWLGGWERVGPFVDLIPCNSASLSQWAPMPSASAYVF